MTSMRGRLGGPSRSGELNGRAKLTDAQTRLIRQLAREGVWTQVEIAAEFGITPKHVSRIKTGQRNGRVA